MSATDIHGNKLAIGIMRQETTQAGASLKYYLHAGDKTRGTLTYSAGGHVAVLHTDLLPDGTIKMTINPPQTKLVLETVNVILRTMRAHPSVFLQWLAFGVNPQFNFMGRYVEHHERVIVLFSPTAPEVSTLMSYIE